MKTDAIGEIIEIMEPSVVAALEMSRPLGVGDSAPFLLGKSEMIQVSGRSDENSRELDNNVSKAGSARNKIIGYGET